ncbi:anhydro-N-acetylmuramic acid kinase [Asticcacaulis sp. BYS171W]|uniref:Anhydro-N-acetylmuramic acid kinase n=1 Tax=Asticcacaulis aquaticus TaxID=2984212 RepID=A0ABT5HNS0_9CAUL|nr:anhydro-N-acetylmuramic acid kinase [Asticcacaulis aquaticus]MDC7681708.1 anhydro-N-acetylmuramic acid kinase [Asticcacaulis aquaticus]
MKIIGFMTGTSLDGIDMAVLDTDGEAQLSFGAYAEKPMRVEVRAVLEAATKAALQWPRGETEPEIFTEARRVIADFHLSALDEFVRENDLNLQDFDALGVHGQTVLHERPKAGIKGRTVQLFDGQYFADRTGMPVVCDFRQADIEAGGEAAPLAPVYHRALALASGMDLPVVVVNLGGVANITVVREDGLTALDTGPASGLMDQWIRQHTGALFDENGAVAAKGGPDMDVVTQYLSHPYFQANAPKSLDRYDFTLEPVASLGLEDGMATLMAFTVESLRHEIERAGIKPNAIVLCGGGRNNLHMVSRLRARLADLAEVKIAEDMGWRGGAIEAEAFAYMAARSLRGLPISFPGTTGVKAPLTGGVVHQPRRASQESAA